MKRTVRVTLQAEAEVEIEVEVDEDEDPTDLTPEDERRVHFAEPGFADWNIVGVEALD